MRDFNLEEAKAGKPVCNRKGDKVIIVSFIEEKFKYPITAKVYPYGCKENNSLSLTFTIDGKYDISGIETQWDLMMEE